MKFAGLAKKAQKFTTDNSTTILTAIGVTGAVTSAILTGKATVKAVQILDEAQKHPEGYTDTEHRSLNRNEKFKLIWKLYIPAAGVLTLTCASIICANRIGTRRTAAVASAFALTERAFDEYREKVVQHMGKKEERVVRDEVAQDRVNRSFSEQGPTVIQMTGKVLLHDEYSGRFFEGTVNGVDKAVNEINRQIGSQFEGYATLSDFYDKIGLTNTSLSDEMGWNAKEPLKIEWTTCTTPDGQLAAHSFEFQTRPVLRPWKDVDFR